MTDVGGNNADESEPQIETSAETPWLIAVSRALIHDRVGERLGPDALLLGLVLAEQQDRKLRHDVGFFRGQLAKRCGFPEQNPRRLREARKLLAEDGWLWFDLPAGGESAETVYRITPKVIYGIDSTPYTRDDIVPTTEQATRYENVTPVQNCIAPRDESVSPPGTKLSHIHIVNNHIVNSISSESTNDEFKLESSTRKSAKASRKNFTPPNIEEVRAYCGERGNTIDAEHFVSHYEARGWMLKDRKMVDWKATVRTWEKNESKFGLATGEKATRNGNSRTLATGSSQKFDPNANYGFGFGPANETRHRAAPEATNVGEPDQRNGPAIRRQENA